MRKEKEFFPSVWRILKRIPRGRVSTYKKIAKALGKPKELLISEGKEEVITERDSFGDIAGKQK